MPADISLLCTRADLDRVRPLARCLRDEGWTVRSASAGSEETAKDDPPRVLLVFLSTHASRSRRIRAAVLSAPGGSLTVVARLDDVELPDFLEGPSLVDLTRPDEACDRLVEHLAPLLPRTKAVASPARRPSKGRARKQPGLSRSMIAIAALLVGLGSGAGWALLSGSSRDPVRSAPPLGPLRSGFVHAATHPDSDALYPQGWEVVDESPAPSGWAIRVREPRSQIEFLLVEPGEFVMGSPPDEEGRKEDEHAHRVVITRPFYMGVYEVSVTQVGNVIDEDRRSDMPYDRITFDQARELCRRIGCDLPTEAQWEYVARGGTSAPWFWEATGSSGALHANLMDETARDSLLAHANVKLDVQFEFRDGHPGPSPIGSFEPNPFGFHDMIGNVWEWCRDMYQPDLGSGTAVDPYCEWSPSGVRVLRGGSFCSLRSQSRVAYRLPAEDPAITPGMPGGDHQTGFRMVLNLPAGPR